jgi:hypothetical protein
MSMVTGRQDLWEELRAVLLLITLYGSVPKASTFLATKLAPESYSYVLQHVGMVILKVNQQCNEVEPTLSMVVTVAGIRS